MAVKELEEEVAALAARVNEIAVNCDHAPSENDQESVAAEKDELIENKKTHIDFTLLIENAMAKYEQDRENHKTLEDFDHILPPLISPNQRTIILDLDETLIHAKPSPPERFDFVVTSTVDGIEETNYVIKRPGLHDFFDSISKKYELVVFTAALEEYASAILDVIDQNRVISHRLYRDSCIEFDDGKCVKDLSLLGRDLKNVVIVDDNPNAYSLQPENAIPVKKFVGDCSHDVELCKLMKFFEQGCDCYVDIRDAVKEFLTLRNDVYWW